MIRKNDMSVDRLTKLDDFESFTQDFQLMLEAALGADSEVSIGLIDIDLFGQYNEEYGKKQGDALLQEITRHIVESLTGPQTVYRYGGDALMILYKGVEREQAFLHLEAVRDSFAGSAAGCTFSGGVAAFPDDGTTPVDIARKCSAALYRAKVNGRNKVCIAREEKMVTKTTYYTSGQLAGLNRLSKRESLNEATLLREALDDLLRKHNS